MQMAKQRLRDHQLQVKQPVHRHPLCPGPTPHGTRRRSTQRGGSAKCQQFPWRGRLQCPLCHQHTLEGRGTDRARHRLGQTLRSLCQGQALPGSHHSVQGGLPKPEPGVTLPTHQDGHQPLQLALGWPETGSEDKTAWPSEGGLVSDHVWGCRVDGKPRGEQEMGVISCLREKGHSVQGRPGNWRQRARCRLWDLQI